MDLRADRQDGRTAGGAGGGQAAVTMDPTSPASPVTVTATVKDLTVTPTLTVR